MTPQPQGQSPVTRRQFLRNSARVAALTGLGGLVGVVAGRSAAKGTVWQIEMCALRQLRHALRP